MLHDTKLELVTFFRSNCQLDDGPILLSPISCGIRDGDESGRRTLKHAGKRSSDGCGASWLTPTSPKPFGCEGQAAVASCVSG